MGHVPETLPTYDQLPFKAGNPAKTAWGLFGDDDQVGMFNLQTPERIVQAASLIRTGKAFPMNWDQSLPSPPLYNRGAVRHTVMRRAGFGHHGDDVLDNFYTQQSSQWDALTHVGDFEHGFWGGVTNEWLIEHRDAPKLGIEHWARRGIAGRAVLLDLGRWFESQGEPLTMDEYRPITADEVEACRAAQGVELQAGDVLLIRIGWIGWYEQTDMMKRQALSQLPNLAFPGLGLLGGDGGLPLRPSSVGGVLGQSGAGGLAAAQLRGPGRVPAPLDHRALRHGDRGDVHARRAGRGLRGGRGLRELFRRRAAQCDGRDGESAEWIGDQVGVAYVTRLSSWEPPSAPASSAGQASASPPASRGEMGTDQYLPLRSGGEWNGHDGLGRRT